MSRQQRTILAEVADAYNESRERFKRHADRGQHDLADEYMSEMQEIERSVHVIETSTSWRRTIEIRRKKEGRA